MLFNLISIVLEKFARVDRIQYILFALFCIFNSFYWLSAHVSHYMLELTFDQMERERNEFVGKYVNQKTPNSIIEAVFVRAKSWLLNLDFISRLVKSRYKDFKGEQPIDPYNCVIAFLLSLPSVIILILPYSQLYYLFFIACSIVVVSLVMIIRNRFSITASAFFFMNALLIGLYSTFLLQMSNYSCETTDAIKCNLLLNDIKNTFIVLEGAYLGVVGLGSTLIMLSKKMPYAFSPNKIDDEKNALLFIVWIAQIFITLEGISFFIVPAFSPF